MVDRYDVTQTWRWNLEHPPEPTAAPLSVAPFPGSWNWCGLPVNSPLGIPAGPLLNGDWLTYYARRGFDILVYKTVRTAERACYDLPNLVPVDTKSLTESGHRVSAGSAQGGSWAVSFGMPSVDVARWQQDVRVTKQQLSPGQILVVSVVGTQDSSGRADQLTDDFAACARLAVQAGADGVEANFSCPNVCTADGQLYQKPDAAGAVAARLRQAVGDVPLVLKIGHVTSRDAAARLIDAVSPYANGLAMTNALSATVQSASGEELFSGESRGICGDAIREASLRQVELFHNLLGSRASELQIIGVGGISTLAHVRDYLNAGASTVAIATAAMLDPDVALKIRESI